jgi:hypothetical protein
MSQFLRTQRSFKIVFLERKSEQSYQTNTKNKYLFENDFIEAHMKKNVRIQ